MELEGTGIVGEVLGKVLGLEELGHWTGNVSQRESVVPGRQVVAGMDFVQKELGVVCREREGRRMCSPPEKHRSRRVGC